MDYLIVYNYQQPYFNYLEVHETIKDLPISDWWHYLPNAYIIRSNHTEKTLADGIIARNPGLLFLIIKVELSKTSGVLNKSAWDWINNKVRTMFKLQSTPTPQLKSIEQFLGGKISSSASTSPSKTPLLSDFFKKK